MRWSRFGKKRDMPEGLWVKCKKCGQTVFQKELEKNLNVCPSCGMHTQLTGRARVDSLVDAGTFEERWKDLFPVDFLEFVDKEPYPAKLDRTVQKTGEIEAAIAGVGQILRNPVALCVLDFSFMGGSMGSVVGEKVARTVECAIEESLPAIIVSASGGARMHEGAVSLMQMAKTSAALERLDRKGGLCISVLTDPTTGGVTASFAALGDVILAEPGALIGFAGPRVIEETLRTELPDGFQRSEFQLEHGFIDKIVPRSDLKKTLSRIVETLWTYPPETRKRYPPAVPADSPAG
jgi:acetyl-CoA carboxylase carboxyl transferase subunit beta